MRWFCLALLLAFTPARADDEAERIALSRRLIELNRTADLMEQGLRQQVAIVRRQFERQNPGRSGEIAALSAELMSAEFQARLPALIEQLVAIQARHYTLDELTAILAFQESPAGRSMREKQPALLQEITGLAMAHVGQSIKSLTERLKELAPQRGLKLPERI